MTPLRRWCVVAVLVALVAAVPNVSRLLPVSDPDTSAADLLAQVQGSEDSAYQGYVESTGRVQIPVGDKFSDLGDLFGAPSRLRVWWDGPDAWRVARLELSGEVDVVHSRRGTATYDYEDARVVLARDPRVRLPGTVDVVPPSMARIALTGATADEVERIPARRVAGVSAPGLRYTPTSKRTSIDHVDVWVDPDSGVALGLEATSKGADQPDFTTTFKEFSAGRPDAADVSFEPAPDVARDFTDSFDLIDAADQNLVYYYSVRKIAGLERTSRGRGSVSVYGEGVERIIALPLNGREAGPLREALAGSRGATAVTIHGPRYEGGGMDNDLSATVVVVGPLGVIVTGTEDDDGYLLAGTVTPETLRRAAKQLIFPTGFFSTITEMQ